MELRTLRYFVTVAEELNFGRAAKRLYITQPGLSQGIKALERKMGLPLFERSRQRVMLTNAGETLLPVAVKLLAHADELGMLVKHLAVTQRGTLRISSTLSAGIGLPSTLTASFRKACPHITIQTLSGFTRLNVDRVRSREVDVGFVYPPIDLAEELTCSVLAWESVVVAAPLDHPLTASTTVDPADLADQPLVFFPKGSSGLSKSILDAVFGQDGVPEIIRVEPDEPHLLAAVSEKAGLSLLTESSARMLNVPGVVIRPLTRSTTVPLAVTWRQDNANSALKTYLGFARDFAQPTPEEYPLTLPVG